MNKGIKELIRVGINNNFNCTSREFAQVEGFRMIRPDAYFFINSNIKTPKLLDINKHNINVVVTVNPDIVVEKKHVEKLYKLNKKQVSFVRVRYVPNNDSIKELIKELSSKGYKVVITVMRFASNDSVNKYSKKEYYDYSFSWFRLKSERIKELDKFIKNLKGVYICDRNGLGCSGCGLCSKLNVGKELTVYGLNLSSSGVCPFNCPDCYAKKMQKFLIASKCSPMVYDVVKQNEKQAGTTEHIIHKKTQLKAA